MIHRSVKRGGGRRWARRSVLLCGGLCVGLAANLSAIGQGRPGLRGLYRGGGRGAVRDFTRLLHTAVIVDPRLRPKVRAPCSACHTAWPELNAFGQKFKDNGYQLGNDRDSPIWVNPSYWPDRRPHHAAVAPGEHHQPAGG